LPRYASAGERKPLFLVREFSYSTKMTVKHISAITLIVSNMFRSAGFYKDLGFVRLLDGPNERFTSYKIGASFLNLASSSRDDARPQRLWGRLIFHVDDVDTLYQLALDKGLKPEAEPRDAEWGERYFHLRDPDGHGLSFSKVLEE
jgi:catechol 2,3-dioxygenase-like lactoylglutathione lyase family enzyme